MTACRSLVLAATALLMSIACRGSSGPKVTLRYHPPAGASYHYALEQQNSVRMEGGPMSAMPEQLFTMRLFYTQVVTGPAQGGVRVTVTFDSTAIEASGMGAGAMGPALDRMRGMKSDIVYDDRMRVVTAAFSGLAGAPSPMTEQMGTSVKTMVLPLPEGPVGVGDSWVTEQELPLGRQLNASQPIKSRTKLTVKEIQVAGADTSVLLAIETEFPGGPIEFKQEAAEGTRGGKGTMRLSGTLSGEQLYSLTKSAQVRSTMGGTMRINVKGPPPAGSEMAMAMTQHTSLQLTEAK